MSFFFLSAHVYPPLQLLQDGLDLEFLLREILHSGIVHGTVRIATDFLSNAFCIHRLLCLFHFYSYLCAIFFYLPLAIEEAGRSWISATAHHLSDENWEPRRMTYDSAIGSIF